MVQNYGFQRRKSSRTEVRNRICRLLVCIHYYWIIPTAIGVVFIGCCCGDSMTNLVSCTFSPNTVTSIVGVMGPPNRMRTRSTSTCHCRVAVGRSRSRTILQSIRDHPLVHHATHSMVYTMAPPAVHSAVHLSPSCWSLLVRSIVHSACLL